MAERHTGGWFTVGWFTGGWNSQPRGQPAGRVGMAIVAATMHLSRPRSETHTIAARLTTAATGSFSFVDSVFLSRVKQGTDIGFNCNPFCQACLLKLPCRVRTLDDAQTIFVPTQPIETCQNAPEGYRCYRVGGLLADLGFDHAGDHGKLHDAAPATATKDNRI